MKCKVIRQPTDAERARFWAKVEDADPITGCREWTAFRHPKGYGRVKFGNGDMQAHRVAAVWAWGVMPEGTEPDHLCKNRACVEVSHLEMVTPEVNLWRKHGTRWSVDCFDVLRRILDHPDELVTRTEAGAMLGVVNEAMYAAVRRGELRETTLTRRVGTWRVEAHLIAKSELARFVIRRGYEDAGLGALRAFADHVDPHTVSEEPAA